MKLVFYTNFLNHHQVLVADALYAVLGNDYAFVTTVPLNPALLKGGEDYSKTRPFCLNAHESAEAKAQAMKLSREAEVCIFGANAQEYAVERAKHNPQGLSIEIGERWLKHGWLTIGSPVFRKWLKNYYLHYRKANFHKLCASSFTKGDDEKLGAYKGRHYKWGYFTKVNDLGGSMQQSCGSNGLSGSKGVSAEQSKTLNQPKAIEPLEPSQRLIEPRTTVRLMWCARFLTLKHPEMVIEMAKRLKEKGLEFHLDMLGDSVNAVGHEKLYPRESLELRVENLELKDYVTFHGNLPNTEVLAKMKESDVFLFTSNRFEGWGAVVNESMANHCAVVAADCIGSTSYLVKDCVTGFAFKGEDVESLTEKVEWLITHPAELEQMKQNAYQQMMELWSPKKAANALLQLINDLQNGIDTSIKDGPCSKA